MTSFPEPTGAILNRMKAQGPADVRTCPDCGKPLPVHDLPIIGRWSPPLCDACEKAENERQAAEERKLAGLQLWKSSNLPPTARSWTFERARQASDPNAYYAVAGWPGGPTGIYLHGRAGCGKTILAWCLLNREILEQGRSGLFVNVPELLADIRRNFAGGSSAIVDRARDVQLLVMDDLGTEKPTEWAREQLFVIINRRVEHRLPTIFTSNLKPGELDKHLGDPNARIVDRIVGSCRIVAIDRPSFRMEQARERMGGVE